MLVAQQCKWHGSHQSTVRAMVNLNTCDCLQDGFCKRYNREMGGRFREICRGINVDVGTATVFREQWLREVIPTQEGGSPTPLLLKTDQMPGDTVAMTAAVYSLHRAYPGRYATAVQSNWPEVFEHNPDVVPIETIPDATPLQMHYPAIHQCNQRGIHFMQAWTEFLGAALSINIPLATNRPRLYFPDTNPRPENFWVVCSGGKRDFTNKLWGHHNYQEVVDRLHGKVRFIQIGSDDDDHRRLRNVEDAVGKTTLRGLFNLIRRSRGVLCGVSLPMHVAAAFERPAIVVAGGREPVQWNAYPRQQYLHTVGALPCSSVQGEVGQACWRSRVLPLGDGAWYDNDTCQIPVEGLPQCMRMISPTEVSIMVLKYDSI